jgi:hypothetical protein
MSLALAPGAHLYLSHLQAGGGPREMDEDEDTEAQRRHRRLAHLFVGRLEDHHRADQVELAQHNVTSEVYHHLLGDDRHRRPRRGLAACSGLDAEEEIDLVQKRERGESSPCGEDARSVRGERSLHRVE